MIDLNDTEDFKEAPRFTRKLRLNRKSQSSSSNATFSDIINLDENDCGHSLPTVLASKHLKSVEIKEEVGSKDCYNKIGNPDHKNVHEVVSSIMDKSNLQKCVICGLDIDALIFRTHQLNCLRQNFAKLDKGKVVQRSEEFKCEICNKNITHMNSHLRIHHLNICLNKKKCASKQEMTYQHKLVVARTSVLNCPMCGKQFKVQSSRQSHLKRCAANNNMTVDQVKNIIKQQEEEHESNLNAGILPQDFVLTKSKQLHFKSLKACGSKGQMDEDMQLALALSNSLVENKKEDIVNLNGETQTIASRRHGKCQKEKLKAQTSLLMTASKEEATNRISARIIRYIFVSNENCQDHGASTVKTRKVCGLSTSALELSPPPNLWSKTSLDKARVATTSQLLVDNTRDLTFYVSQLMPPVSVNTVSVGSKLRRVSVIPGRPMSQELHQDFEINVTDNNTSPQSSQTVEVLTKLALESGQVNKDNSCCKYFCATNDMCSLQSSRCVSTVNLQPSNCESTVNLQPSNCESTVSLQPSNCESTVNRQPSKCENTVKLQMEINTSNLIVSYLGLINNPRFSDIIIRADNGDEIFAHKLILFTRCPELLAISEINNGKDIIDLSSFGKESIMCMLKYVYGGQTSLMHTSACATELKQLSTRFCLTGLAAVVCGALEIVGVNNMTKARSGSDLEKPFSVDNMTSESDTDSDSDGDGNGPPIQNERDAFDYIDWQDVCQTQKNHLDIKTNSVENSGVIIKSEMMDLNCEVSNNCINKSESLEKYSHATESMLKKINAGASTIVGVNQNSTLMSGSSHAVELTQVNPSNSLLLMDNSLHVHVKNETDELEISQVSLVNSLIDAANVAPEPGVSQMPLLTAGSSHALITKEATYTDLRSTAKTKLQKRKSKKVSQKEFKTLVHKVLSSLTTTECDLQQQTDLTDEDIFRIQIKIEQDLQAINDSSVYIPNILEDTGQDQNEVIITHADIKTPLRPKRKLVKKSNVKVSVDDSQLVQPVNVKVLVDDSQVPQPVNVKVLVDDSQLPQPVNVKVLVDDSQVPQPVIQNLSTYTAIKNNEHALLQSKDILLPISLPLVICMRENPLESDQVKNSVKIKTESQTEDILSAPTTVSSLTETPVSMEDSIKKETIIEDVPSTGVFPSITNAHGFFLEKNPIKELECSQIENTRILNVQICDFSTPKLVKPSISCLKQQLSIITPILNCSYPLSGSPQASRLSSSFDGSSNAFPFCGVLSENPVAPGHSSLISPSKSTVQDKCAAQDKYPAQDRYTFMSPESNKLEANTCLDPSNKRFKNHSAEVCPHMHINHTSATLSTDAEYFSEDLFSDEEQEFNSKNHTDLPCSSTDNLVEAAHPSHSNALFTKFICTSVNNEKKNRQASPISTSVNNEKKTRQSSPISILVDNEKNTRPSSPISISVNNEKVTRQSSPISISVDNEKKTRPSNSKCLHTELLNPSVYQDKSTIFKALVTKFVSPPAVDHDQETKPSNFKALLAKLYSPLEKEPSQSSFITTQSTKVINSSVDDMKSKQSNLKATALSSKVISLAFDDDMKSKQTNLKAKALSPISPSVDDDMKSKQSNLKSKSLSSKIISPSDDDENKSGSEKRLSTPASPSDPSWILATHLISCSPVLEEISNKTVKEKVFDRRNVIFQGSAEMTTANSLTAAALKQTPPSLTRTIPFIDSLPCYAQSISDISFSKQSTRKSKSAITPSRLEERAQPSTIDISHSLNSIMATIPSTISSIISSIPTTVSSVVATIPTTISSVVATIPTTISSVVATIPKFADTHLIRATFPTTANVQVISATKSPVSKPSYNSTVLNPQMSSDIKIQMLTSPVRAHKMPVLKPPAIMLSSSVKRHSHKTSHLFELSTALGKDSCMPESAYHESFKSLAISSVSRSVVHRNIPKRKSVKTNNHNQHVSPMLYGKKGEKNINQVRPNKIYQVRISGQEGHPTAMHENMKKDGQYAPPVHENTSKQVGHHSTPVQENTRQQGHHARPVDENTSRQDAKVIDGENVLPLRQRLCFPNVMQNVRGQLLGSTTMSALQVNSQQALITNAQIVQSVNNKLSLPNQNLEISEVTHSLLKLSSDKASCAKTPQKKITSKKRASGQRFCNEPSPFTPMAPYEEMTTPELKKAVSKIGVRPVGKKRMRELLKHVYEETHQYETDSDYDGTPVKKNCVISHYSDLSTRALISHLPITTAAVTVSQNKLKPAATKTSAIVKIKPAAKKTECKTYTSADNNKVKAMIVEDKIIRLQNRMETNSQVLGVDANRCPENSGKCSSVNEDIRSSHEEIPGSQDSSYSDDEDLPEESILHDWPNNYDDVIPSQIQASIQLVKHKIVQFVHSNQHIYESILMYEPLELDMLKKNLSDAAIKVNLSQVMDFLDERCITFTMKKMSSRKNNRLRKLKNSQQSPNKKNLSQRLVQ